MNEFIIAQGYKKEAIIRYFLEVHHYSSDLTVHTGDGSVTVHEGRREPNWIVHPIDMGAMTDTGGRIKRLAPHIGNTTFMLTWCDGLSNINLKDLLAFHRSHGKLATVTTVRAPGRFGYIELDGDDVSRFREKLASGDGRINSSRASSNTSTVTRTSWERESMEQLATGRQLAAYRHGSFWQWMDTLREKRLLDEL